MKCAQIAGLLSSVAKKMVKDLRFKSMLMMPNRPADRDFLKWLMGRASAEHNKIQLKIGEVILNLRPKDVYLILGIGRGGGSNSELPKNKSMEEF